MIIYYLIFFLFFIVYSLIIIKTKQLRFISYAISGSLIGFIFDLISFENGYYSYPDFYYIKIVGLPLSMTIEEGFAIAITIFLFENILNKFVRITQQKFQKQ